MLKPLWPLSMNIAQSWEEVADDGGRVDWNGSTIGFCCPGCIDEWNKLSDTEKTDALAKAGKEQSDHDHSEHTEGEAG